MARAVMGFLLIAIVIFSAPAQQAGSPVITSPQAGEAVRGIVTVTGSSDVPGFVSAEIAFAYASDATGTWYLLASSSQPVTEGNLATWDTTIITDGTYHLRLRVYLADGTFLDAIIQDLRVRNYTLVETPTPTGTLTPTVTPLSVPTATPIPTATLTATPFPTPTELSGNPATISPPGVYSSILYGGLAAVLLFVIFGIYLLLRRR